MFKSMPERFLAERAPFLYPEPGRKPIVICIATICQHILNSTLDVNHPIVYYTLNMEGVGTHLTLENVNSMEWGRQL